MEDDISAVSIAPSHFRQVLARTKKTALPRARVQALSPSCYFESAPRFLSTPANPESTTGAANPQTGSMDDLSISLVDTLAGL